MKHIIAAGQTSELRLQNRRYRMREGPMQRLKLCAAILLPAMLAACAGRETPKTVTDTSCTAFKALSFSVQGRATETADNLYDTPQTIGDIIEHNARWDALCAKGN